MKQQVAELNERRGGRASYIEDLLPVIALSINPSWNTALVRFIWSVRVKS